MPELIEPAIALEGSSAEVTIRGRNFFLDVFVDYDENANSGVDGTFSAFLGTSALGSVTYVDSRTIHAIVPPNLARGPHALRIIDPAGRIGVLGSAFTITGCFRVTTGVDEQDSSESPFPPHLGAGLSMREAVVLANSTPGRNCIRVSNMTLQPATELPVFSDSAGLVVTGDPGARIRGNLLITGTPVGLDLASSGNEIRGLEFFDFDGGTNPAAIEIRPGTSTNRVTGCTFRSSSGLAILVAGTSHDIAASSFDDAGVSIEVHGSDVRIEGNFIRRGTIGIQISTGSRRTVAIRNLFSEVPSGITLSQTADARIDHNTFDRGASAIGAFGGVSGTVVRNAIVTNASLIGISGGGGSFQTLDHIVFFGNAGDCPPCAASPNIVNADPLYVSPATGDFTPGPGSPAIDSGFDTGLDVNGALPGLFNGIAPDRGWMEAP